MRSFLLPLLCAIVAMLLWAGLVFIATLNGWGRKPLAPTGNANAFMQAATQEIDAKHRGNAAFRLIENGKLHNEYFAGDSVNSETLFQVASLSKWISAWGVMTLVEAGKLDLDAPVATYLTRCTIDFLMFMLVAKKMITIALIGWGVIILTALFIGWRRSRQRRNQTADPA